MDILKEDLQGFIIISVVAYIMLRLIWRTAGIEIYRPGSEESVTALALMFITYLVFQFRQPIMDDRSGIMMFMIGALFGSFVMYDPEIVPTGEAKMGPGKVQRIEWVSYLSKFCQLFSVFLWFAVFILVSRNLPNDGFYTTRNWVLTGITTILLFLWWVGTKRPWQQANYPWVWLSLFLLIGTPISDGTDILQSKMTWFLWGSLLGAISMQGFLFITMDPEWRDPDNGQVWSSSSISSLVTGLLAKFRDPECPDIQTKCSSLEKRVQDVQSRIPFQSFMIQILFGLVGVGLWFSLR